MSKSIYTRYKERLIEIGGKNKCLYLSKTAKRSSFDLGRLFFGRQEKCDDFVSFLFSDGNRDFSLISASETDEIFKSFAFQNGGKRAAEKRFSDADIKTFGEALEKEISDLSALRREVEDIEHDTGRYELYIGYPFVTGTIVQGIKKMPIKAPLLLFPAVLELQSGNTVNVSLNGAEKIRINPAFMFAYAQARRLSLDSVSLEFDDFSDFRSLSDVLRYLDKAGVSFRNANLSALGLFSKMHETESPYLSLQPVAVLGRFSIANSIYNDYSLLEKQNLTNDAIDELLSPVKAKRKKYRVSGRCKAMKSRDSRTYAVRNMDYSQAEVVKKVASRGNVVIYGPPGTGKSQTIVNIITDAIGKGQKVLVVSQKKAALDVVFNRLGNLNQKAVYVQDETKSKAAFYGRCAEAHNRMMASESNAEELSCEYDALERKIQEETDVLADISGIMNARRPYGLSLTEMYRSSYMLTKGSADYALYLRMLEYPEILSLNHRQLTDALSAISSKELGKTYYSFMTDKEKNPIIDHMRDDLDIRTLSEVRGQLAECAKVRKGFFNTAKYPYYRQVLAYYYDIADGRKCAAVAKLTSHFSPDCTRRQIEEAIVETRAAIAKYLTEYECLNRVLTPDGYLAVVDNILRGNTAYVHFVSEALENYLALRNLHKMLDSLGEDELNVLNFAYAQSRNYKNFTEILAKLPVLRIYHELTKYEELYRDRFSATVDFANISARISNLTSQMAAVSERLVLQTNDEAYKTRFQSAQNSNDFLHQICKQSKYWPIRKTMEVYGDFITDMFPCFLLSPENVSSVLPLRKNMFDLVVFDEASQVFIENTIPAIFRGRHVVVAGDEKQLRPSATFVRRYLGAEEETGLDYSTQAALEVESLLDLAVSRYERVHLTYHYRSRCSELIDFSNHAFYNVGLQIAPNVTKSQKNPPITRIKTDGRWGDRKNLAEAEKIVGLVKEILSKRRQNETLGIITFNADQQNCIAELLEKEAAKDLDFRTKLFAEMHRFENGEDVSLFVKNLENVQGDERDVILFSIGYAFNEEGKLYTNFGLLSAEGGENRLNVAVTRAKSRVYVVTSIEPEDLRVENSKYMGPKLLKKYLVYVRAVSEGDLKGAQDVLKEVSGERETAVAVNPYAPEDLIKDKLEKLGYRVDVRLGEVNSRISLAVYDEERGVYLVGVELDNDAFRASGAVLERDVFKPRFMESRGWTLLRIWSRDFWISPARVVRTIASYAEKAKKKQKN